MDITTTRSNPGNLATTTEGGGTASPFAGKDIGGFLTAVLAAKAAKDQPKKSYNPGEYLDAQPRYVPELGTQQSSPVQKAKAPLKRVRTLRGYQDPNRVAGAGGISQAMNPGTDMDEYHLGYGPNGQDLGWSLDAKYGTLAGNEAAALKTVDRQLMPFQNDLQGFQAGGGSFGEKAGSPYSIYGH